MLSLVGLQHCCRRCCRRHRHHHHHLTTAIWEKNYSVVRSEMTRFTRKIAIQRIFHRHHYTIIFSISIISNPFIQSLSLHWLSSDHALLFASIRNYSLRPLSKFFFPSLSFFLIKFSTFHFRARTLSVLSKFDVYSSFLNTQYSIAIIQTQCEMENFRWTIRSVHHHSVIIGVFVLWLTLGTWDWDLDRLILSSAKNFQKKKFKPNAYIKQPVIIFRDIFCCHWLNELNERNFHQFLFDIFEEKLFAKNIILLFVFIFVLSETLKYSNVNSNGLSLSLSPLFEFRSINTSMKDIFVVFLLV